MTKRETRRKYTKEFKEEAVQLVLDQGRSQREVASNLGINANMLRRWVREYRDNTEHVFPGNGNPNDRDDKIRQLEKRLADAEMERDILKKAVAIFSKPPQRNTGL